MSATLSWQIPSGATPSSFQVYRAITGLSVSFPNSLQAGDVLSCAATSSAQQNVKLTAIDITSVAAAINGQALGVRATVATGGTTLLIRCTATCQPRLKILPCSAAQHLALTTPLLVTPRQTFVSIGSVPFVTGQTAYQFTDHDGDPTDWYQITTITSGVESLPSIAQQPNGSTDTLCIVEGRVTDLRGASVAAAEIRARPTVPPNQNQVTGLNIDYAACALQTVTDQYGRWSLALPQNMVVTIEIDAIRYGQTVTIPAAATANYVDLVPTTDHYFAPTGEY